MSIGEFVFYGTKVQEFARFSGSIEESHDDVESMIFISSIPWVTYTSLVQPISGKVDSNPRITWGKFSKKGEDIIMPVSVLCNHALVDGIHIGMFYAYLEEIMKELIKKKL